MDSFFLVDLSSPHLVDLIDEKLLNSDPPIVGIDASLWPEDLDRVPIQRGLATVERAGLPLRVHSLLLAAQVQERFPNLVVECR